MFKNMLEELMIWHASLLQSLLDRQENPDMKHVRRLSALNEQKWQRQRREEKKKERIDEGVRLSAQRDSRKRKFEEMSATEQQNLEDYDTCKTHKAHAKASGKRLPQLRGKMFPGKDTPNATAAEHGCCLPTPLLQSMAVISQSILSFLRVCPNATATERGCSFLATCP